MDTYYASRKRQAKGSIRMQIRHPPATPNPALNLAPFGRWTLRDKTAQRRLALRYTAVKSVALALALFVPAVAHATPCDGVDRTLSDARKSQLAPVIARQMKIESADILQSYKYAGWYIIYVNTHVSDEAFLFFGGDPLQSKYLTAWGGAAAVFEGPQIRRWVFKNAKGIPTKLASCFAWHVTKDRDL
jgi:hypothetical protein